MPARRHPNLRLGHLIPNLVASLPPRLGLPLADHLSATCRLSPAPAIFFTVRHHASAAIPHRSCLSLRALYSPCGSLPSLPPYDKPLGAHRPPPQLGFSDPSAASALAPSSVDVLHRRLTFALVPTSPPSGLAFPCFGLHRHGLRPAAPPLPLSTTSTGSPPRLSSTTRQPEPSFQLCFPRQHRHFLRQPKRLPFHRGPLLQPSPPDPTPSSPPRLFPPVDLPQLRPPPATIDLPSTIPLEHIVSHLSATPSP